MVILSRIVKPKMFEPQKYRRKGSQPALEAPAEKKKTCTFTKSISKSLSSQIFGMFGLENF